jgi:hypothetical protein
VVKDLGNVTTASECSFAYSFRPKEEIGDLKDLKEIPFQVQVRYKLVLSYYLCYFVSPLLFSHRL